MHHFVQFYYYLLQAEKDSMLSKIEEKVPSFLNPGRNRIIIIKCLSFIFLNFIFYYCLPAFISHFRQATLKIFLICQNVLNIVTEIY